MTNLFRLALVIFIVFLLIRPINFFCNKTNICQEINIAKYIPTFFLGNDPVNIKFITKNNSPNILFEPQQKTIATVTGEKNIVKFNIKNISQKNKTIKFKIKYNVQPTEYSKYIKLHKCLCSMSFSLKPNQEKNSEVIFSIKNNFSKIIKNNNKNNIDLIYELIES